MFDNIILIINIGFLCFEKFIFEIVVYFYSYLTSLYACMQNAMYVHKSIIICNTFRTNVEKIHIFPKYINIL